MNAVALGLCITQDLILSDSCCLSECVTQPFGVDRAVS